MKILDIDNYVSERVKVKPVTNAELDVVKKDYERNKQYKYFPDNIVYLVSMIYKRIMSDGPECDLNDIDISKITDLSGLFIPTRYKMYLPDIPLESLNNAFRSFNGDISKWDVSHVKNMKEMFKGAKTFNGDISKWDVHNVTNMEDMFYDAESFNQPIGGWTVSNVTDMAGMFSGATNFNSDISNWDISNVTDMTFMFREAINFNKPLNWGEKTSNVSKMEGMFHSAISFNKPIGSWNVENVKDMSYMFCKAESFNQDISGWKFVNITDMSGMFSKALSFDKDLSGWILPKRKIWHSYMFSSSPLQKQKEKQPKFYK